MRFNKPTNYNPVRVAPPAAPRFSKITEQQVIEARARVREGEKLADLASEYDVNKDTLNGAVNGKSWQRLNADHPPVKQFTYRSKEETMYILRLYSDGMSVRDIACKLQVPKNSVSSIIQGDNRLGKKHWRPFVSGKEQRARRSFTAGEVIRIRALHQEGYGARKLAAMFDSTNGTISRICRGDSYKDVPMPEGSKVSYDFYHKARKNRSFHERPEDIVQMRMAYDNGEKTIRQLSVLYGTSYETARRIARRISYNNI